jgi:hypothetical protein
MNDHVKRIPTSIGIFGASDHIGDLMARWLRYNERRRGRSRLRPHPCLGAWPILRGFP